MKAMRLRSRCRAGLSNRKGQTILEDTIEERPDRSGKMVMPHHRLVEKLEQQAQKDAKDQQTSVAFNEMSMMD